MKKSHLRHTLFALSVAACLVPGYAQSQSMGGTSATDTGSRATPSSSPSSHLGASHSGSTAGSSIESRSSSTDTLKPKGNLASDQAMTEADRSLNTRIREALNADSSLRDASQNVNVRSENGVVTLSGTVATEKEKSDLANRLQRMAGVNRVENKLQIAPRTSNSRMDEPTASR